MSSFDKFDEVFDEKVLNELVTLDLTPEPIEFECRSAAVYSLISTTSVTGATVYVKRNNDLGDGKLR